MAYAAALAVAADQIKYCYNRLPAMETVKSTVYAVGAGILANTRWSANAAALEVREVNDISANIETATDELIKDFILITPDTTSFDEALEKIRQDPKAFEQLKKKLKNSGAFISKAVEVNPDVIPFVPQKFQEIPQIYLNAARDDRVLAHIPTQLKNDIEFLAKLIPINQKSLSLVHDLSLDDQAKLFTELGSEFLSFAPEELKDHQQFMLNMAQIDPRNIQQAGMQLKNNQGFFFQAIKNAAWGAATIAREASPQLLNNQIFCQQLVTLNYQAVNGFSDEQLQSESFIMGLLTACQSKTNRNLAFTAIIDASQCRSDAFMMQAVRLNGICIESGSQEQKKNGQLVLEAFKTYDDALLVADKDLLKDKEFALKAVGIKPKQALEALRSFQGNPQVVKKALERSPDLKSTYSIVEVTTNGTKKTWHAVDQDKVNIHDGKTYGVTMNGVLMK